MARAFDCFFDLGMKRLFVGDEPEKSFFDHLTQGVGNDSTDEKNRMQPVFGWFVDNVPPHQHPEEAYPQQREDGVFYADVVVSFRLPVQLAEQQHAHQYAYDDVAKIPREDGLAPVDRHSQGQREGRILLTR